MLMMMLVLCLIRLPLGEFLDEQLSIAKDIENAEIDDISDTENFETPITSSSPRY